MTPEPESSAPIPNHFSLEAIPPGGGFQKSRWKCPLRRYCIGSGHYLPAVNFGFFFCPQGKKGEVGPPGTPGLLGPQVTTAFALWSLAVLLPLVEEAIGWQFRGWSPQSWMVTSSERTLGGSWVLRSPLAPPASHPCARRMATVCSPREISAAGGQAAATQ